ncbi:MAG: energy transducer TonB [Flavobacteriales bacterium]|nr:energy transducer TonB [Flavobacteriales bacterium]
MIALRKLLVFALVAMAPGFSMAQEPADTAETTTTYIETMPGFPGGEAALFKYLAREAEYPKELAKQGIGGTVYVTFEIDAEGNVQNVRTLRGVHPLLDAEAERVVRSMPRWTPGTQRGKPVRVQYNMPIKFTPGKVKRKK